MEENDSRMFTLYNHESSPIPYDLICSTYYPLILIIYWTLRILRFSAEKVNVNMGAQVVH